MKLCCRLPFSLALILTLAGVDAKPMVRDSAVLVYATVTDPQNLSFAPDGTLYCGRDASGSGGGFTDAVKIHRVGPGGAPVAEFGNAAVSDPDALIVDAAGVVSGTPGAVLVGGNHNNGSTGKISMIAPDGTVTTRFGPDSAFSNPSDFAFDSSGRLLVSDAGSGRVLVSSGGPLTQLFSLAQVNYIAVDALDRIAVTTGNGTALRLYSSTGELLNAGFATVKAASPVARGRGGAWGTDLYAIATNNELIRIDPAGEVTSVGSGFGTISYFTFAPDGALVASDFAADRIYRFGPPGVAGANAAIYARVTDPVRLSFAPDGTLFAGRDNSGSGGTNSDAVKIHRIGLGGAPVTEYGNAVISDPDAVFFDASGQFSGTPGAVLVAGQQFTSNTGKIVKILPDGSITTTFGPTGFDFNPNIFVHDEAGGRLLLSDNVGGKVYAMTGQTPVALFNLAAAFPLAVDAAGRIVAGADNSPWLRLYSASGELLNNQWAAADPETTIVRGPGGLWGHDLFFIGTDWNLKRLADNGVVTTGGSNFGGMTGLTFGPDGALYASQLDNDLIWRFAPQGPPVPTVALTAEGNGYRASWFGLSGLIYQPQTSTSLVTWENDGAPIPGSDGPASVTFAITADPARFFRLKVMVE